MSEWIDNDLTMPPNALVDIMFFDGHIVDNVPPLRYEWGKGAPVLIKAWRPSISYFPEDDRINIIGQNGNDGEHYDSQVDTKNNDIPNTSKTDYYMDEQGEDWIDECIRTMTPEEFRGAMKFVIGKYLRRLGKKDSIVKELTKVADYNERWVDYELALINKKGK